MDFIELDKFLRQLDKEEKLFKELAYGNRKNFIENEIRKIYSVVRDNEEWVINSCKLIKNEDNFAIHKHKRFASFKDHKHDYIELIYVYSGEIKQKINGQEVYIEKGQICILDLNVLHSIEASSENDIAINIIMTEKFFDSMFMSYLSENDIMSKFIIQALYHKKEHSEYLLFPCSDNNFIQDIMKRLLCEYYDRKIAFDTAIHAYILILFTELLRNYNSIMGVSKEKDLNMIIINEVKNYLYGNYKEANLKSTAEHFHFNPDYLGRLITSLTGENFTTLLQNIKLKESCTLLKNSDFSIEEIIDRVGYNNLSYFYKLFKKSFNLTPVQYRKMYLSGRNKL